MAPEAASEGYYVTPYCGDARGYPEASSPDPNVFYRHPGHDDKRALKDGHCGSSQYQSWPAAAGFPTAYAPSDAKGFVPPPHTYCMPPHGPPPMPVAMPAYGHSAAGQMVSPQPPVYGLPAARAPAPRPRTDDSSSSNCTPRDHYSNTERHISPMKRHHRKHEAGPRIPVVKIPETLKKYGHPCPATWFNSRGFPLRPGKPDCKHYTGKGWCAYGTLCKFNHPEGLQAPPVSYAMMPCCNGSSPPMMNTPWMGVQYPWNGPWNQQPASAPMQPGYYPYACHHPCPAGPCGEEESGNSAKSYTGGEHERATDTESDAMYN